MKQKFIQLLKEDFELRKKRNPTYSLRALARDLGIGLGSLSEVLNGKRELSKKNFGKAIEKMFLSDEQKAALRLASMKTKKSQKTEMPELLDENTFLLISDWHYLAILNLAKIKDNSSKPKWIAGRLGITQAQVVEALKRLKKLGLLDTNDGKMLRTSKPLTTSRDIPSLAIKKHHLGNLKLAERALFEEPVERREFGSITMPTNPELLSKAKDLLLKTRIKIGNLLDQGNTREVYTLSFQLFPITRVEEIVKETVDEA